MQFEFATPTKILFGSGRARELGLLGRNIGRRALIVTGRDPKRAEAPVAALSANDGDAVIFPVNGEPTLSTVRKGVELAKVKHCDFVIGFGGGSAIDAGKAIAAMLTNPDDVLDYVEIIGQGKVLKATAAPFIAIPTTAGTGSEVTRNAVLASPEHRLKVSLRSPHMYPLIALVDPELTLDLPAPLTATTGLDALTQLIEAFVSCRANPMIDALCTQGIRRAARSLRNACNDGHNLAAREDMALASLWSGIALANAGLGAVHGFAGPIGGMFPAPHGAVCAALLPHVMATNLRALRERQPDGVALRKFDELAPLLTGDANTVADDAVDWLTTLVNELPVPRLSSYGITPAHANELVEKATAASSMKGNPLPLTTDELKTILTTALQPES